MAPSSRSAQRVQLQINEAQAQIEREQSRIMDRMYNDYNAAAQREKLANATVARQKEDVRASSISCSCRTIFCGTEFDTNPAALPKYNAARKATRLFRRAYARRISTWSTVPPPPPRRSGRRGS